MKWYFCATHLSKSHIAGSYLEWLFTLFALSFSPALRKEKWRVRTEHPSADVYCFQPHPTKQIHQKFISGTQVDLQLVWLTQPHGWSSIVVICQRENQTQLCCPFNYFGHFPWVLGLLRGIFEDPVQNPTGVHKLPPTLKQEPRQFHTPVTVYWHFCHTCIHSVFSWVAVLIHIGLNCCISYIGINFLLDFPPLSRSNLCVTLLTWNFAGIKYVDTTFFILQNKHTGQESWTFFRTGAQFGFFSFSLIVS